MGKSALFAVPTDTCIDPIIAHFGLVFRLLLRVVELDAVKRILALWDEPNHGVVAPLGKQCFAIVLTSCESRSHSRCDLSLEVSHSRVVPGHFKGEWVIV